METNPDRDNNLYAPLLESATDRQITRGLAWLDPSEVAGGELNYRTKKAQVKTLAEINRAQSSGAVSIRHSEYRHLI